MRTDFDVVVIGGGHAGCEAASAAARVGARVALVSLSPKTVGAMSCNPAIGGVGKGHLVREVDALDGLMGLAADAAGIHYRMLNRSKGKAVHGPRVQADRRLYGAAVRRILAEQKVAIVEGEAAALSLRDSKVDGIALADGTVLTSRSTVLATGTFLSARMFRGQDVREGGRLDEKASVRLAAQLRDLGLPMGRLKTGTPPRLDGRTIAWDRLQRQESDGEAWTMSPLTPGSRQPQIACAITRTNGKTHDVVRSGLSQSPLRSGAIEGQGPRYCPSIEDKVDRFGDRDGHQIFLEPEGLDTFLVYPNGISTCLPTECQQAFVNTIAGLEAAAIAQPGYAVEYDYIDPRSLDKRLALELLDNLFFAGQINGTTGYEEAAGQGLVAGLNAAAHALGREPSVFERETSYLGVMIDDLTLQGVSEPYRMLTARAEYRLRLRADNAGTRLEETGHRAGCLGPKRLRDYEARTQRRAAIAPMLSAKVSASALRDIGIEVPDDDYSRSLVDWVRHPGVDDRVEQLMPEQLRGAELSELLEDARYAPYVQRQRDDLDRVRRDRLVALPAELDYMRIPGLSTEMVERLSRARPRTLAEAARIRGITPAALSAIVVARMKRAA